VVHEVSFGKFIAVYDEKEYTYNARKKQEDNACYRERIFTAKVLGLSQQAVYGVMKRSRN